MEVSLCDHFRKNINRLTDNHNCFAVGLLNGIMDNGINQLMGSKLSIFKSLKLLCQTYTVS
jgi:hypothetical protein